MGFLRTLRTVWSKLEARSLARRVMASWFSGSTSLKRIAPLPGSRTGFSLLYDNGRRIALDESGILNPPDPGVGRFVLKSLLRHIRRPSDDPRQRDFAAQAVALIWMASCNRRTAGRAHTGPEGFLGAGSARETAPLR
jgi:hypothetical protein